MNRSAIIFLLVFSLAPFIGGCSDQTGTSDKPLKVGVIPGPQAEIMDVVKQVAAKDGLILQIVLYHDYSQPNVDLSQGKIDANSFQHQPYLDSMVQDRQLEIVSVAKTIYFPMALYSQKLKDLSQLSPGGVVAIPSDTMNCERALRLLEKYGLVKLGTPRGLKATISDIGSNPYCLIFKELDEAIIPGLLKETDLAAINASYAAKAGLSPALNALAIEAADSPYTNILAVRSKDKDSPAIKELIRAYQSDEVKQYIQQSFKGQVLPAW